MIEERYDSDGFEKELEGKELKGYRKTVEKFLDLLENQPPYTSMKVSSNQLFYLSSLCSFKVSMYCEKCKKVHLFKTTEETSDALCELMEISEDTSLRSLVFDYSIAVEGGKGCRETHFLPILIKNSQIQKIGQYPPFDESLTAARLQEKN